jgi:hypothetical protein
MHKFYDVKSTFGTKYELGIQSDSRKKEKVK